MTALSFNLTPSKSIEIAGLPLEGLPQLEAGRTLPQAFAELLGKASNLSPKSAVEPENGGKPAGAQGEVAADADGATPVLEGGLRASAKLVPPILPKPTGEIAANAEPQPTGESEAANGKGLPSARPEIAVDAPETTVAALTPAPTEVVLAETTEVVGDPPKTADSPGTANAPSAPAAPGTDASQVTGGEAGAGKTADVSPPVGKPVPTAESAKPSPAHDETAGPVNSDHADPIPKTAGTPIAPRSERAVDRQHEDSAEKEEPAATPSDVPAPSDLVLAKQPVPVAAPIAQAAVAAAVTVAAPAPASGSGQAPGQPTRISPRGPGIVQTVSSGAVGADASAAAPSPTAPAPQSALRSETQVDQPPRQAGTTSPTQATEKATPEPPQTGLSLQLRAADKPIAADKPVIAAEASQPALQTNSGTSPGQGTAAPLGHTPSATTVLGQAPQTGPLPHFPELAALVDRIAAARSSAGSASATIAVAHKELGNLSLTFEATGNTLDVEVAAQDSDTQRALAAAIAADRPQLRTVDAQAQAPTQTLHSQLASSAHGGGTDARHSGMAGDAQPDRRGDGRGPNRQGGGANAQGRPDPKSDGGIYA